MLVAIEGPDFSETVRTRGWGMGAKEELLQTLEEKLSAVRKMIDQYDEAMDYASHCTLQGFAEGLAFAIDETRHHLKSGLKKGKAG